MAKPPISIEIVEVGEERFIVKTFADGSTQRSEIVKQPRKKRYPDRPYWTWKFDKFNKSKKKGF